MNKENKITVAIAGNPNSGKTTLFNSLTGSNHKIGNWPGVTVEKKVGWFIHKDKEIEVVDIPGIYSLTARSTDERVARDYLLGYELNEPNHRRGPRQFRRRRRENRSLKHQHRQNHISENIPDSKNEKSKSHNTYYNKNTPDLIVNIVDASNIERNLYLTTQLIEMKLPMVVILNMSDVARTRKIEIDPDKLSEKLQVPVIKMVASKGQGIEELKDLILEKIDTNNVHIPFIEEVENSINELSSIIKDVPEKLDINPRWLSIKLLEGDKDLIEKVERISPEIVSGVEDIGNRLTESEDEDSDILIADGRYSFIKLLTEEIQKKKSEFSKTLSDKIDNVVMNSALGIPIFLFVLYALFWISTEVANAGIGFMDALFQGGELLYWDFAGIIPLLQNIVGEGNWIDIIFLQGVLGGVGTVLTFLPILFLVFLILAFLEDWGYLSRAAATMDRFMRFIGLPGKAFISFILGFGCTVPAIMSARTLEDEDERWLTIMLVPFMSCGARLPVYVFFGAIFFASWGGTLIFLLYISGIILAIIIGFILKRWKMKDKPVSTFVIELPPYHIPTVKSVMLTLWARLSAFLKNAGFLITIIVMVLTILGNIQLYIPDDAGEDYEFVPNSRESVIGTVGEAFGVIFKPLRFGEVQDGENEGKVNWRAGVSVFTGLFAKEAIVGTFGALYKLGEEVEAPPFPEEFEPKYNFTLPQINEESSLNEINELIEKLNIHLNEIEEG
ncbi:MAG: ferrous iron transport protein B, partial [Spirochaetota bacterium]